MALRGRIGGLRRAAKYDPLSLTADARQAFLDRFEREANPDGTLPEKERRRRAALLRRAHMAGLARRSAIARTNKTTPARQAKAVSAEVGDGRRTGAG
jgi:hypothetical protein